MTKSVDKCRQLSCGAALAKYLGAGGDAARGSAGHAPTWPCQGDAGTARAKQTVLQSVTLPRYLELSMKNKMTFTAEVAS
jgi:predicted alpha/beta-fold hydrolase